jgi:hypothetical protein
MVHITYTDTKIRPTIKGPVDDAGEYHQEVTKANNQPYLHCYRVVFSRPFAELHYTNQDPAAVIDAMYDTMTDSPEYDALSRAWAASAVLDLGIPINAPFICDWRDEQELWIRTDAAIAM